MKQSKLASLLAVTISLELMVSPLIPVAVAETPSTTTSPAPIGKRDPEKQAANVINTTAEAVGVTLQVAGQIYNEVRGTINNQSMTPQLAGDMAKLKEQMTPTTDKYFNAQKLMQLPGLANYLALNNINPGMLECKTLPTTLHDAKPEVCRIGITGDKGAAPQAQMGQMFTYYNQYFQVGKMYKNFMADSNSDGQAFGVGCMNNAMMILNGFFKYRLDELDKLSTNLEAMQDQFKKASRSDLDAIEESTAVLEGDSELADKVRSKKPDLFDFGKRFNNAACNSMFAGEKLNEMGRGGGLNAINTDLKKTLTAKNGKYSGESYSKMHTAVLEDLEGLADKVSKQLELNFSVLSKDPSSYGKFLADLPDLVSSPNGANRALSSDLFSDVRTKFNDNFIKLNEQKTTVENELRAAGVPADSATRLLGNAASTNFENEVVSIENGLKNKCFQDTLSDIDKDKLMDKIYDPTASSHANKYASNFLKDKLNKILDNKETSLEKKLSELKALESQTGGRYFLKMENSYEVQDVDDQGNLKQPEVVSASNIRTPSVFFSDLIRNCNAQFKANKLSNKMSGASAIQKLRQLNNDYKTLAKNQAADMKKEVRKKLIECSSPEEANNSVPGSCTPDRFNTSTPGFCANAALSCSKNMQACAQQAEGYVKEIKDQRTARVNNYKSLVEKNKMDVIKMFDSALSRYMKDGEALRGLFGAGFSSPSGIQREVDEGSKYLQDFVSATSRSQDGKLLLEDPAAHMEMFKKNIALLKDSVKKQQDQILGGDATGQGSRTPGLLAQHIEKTRKNYQEVQREADQIANQCLQKHDGAIAAAEQQRIKQQEEYQKKMTEMGEKRQEYCNRLAMLEYDVNGACENVGSLTRDVMGAVGTADARRTAGEFSAYCRSTNNANSTGSAPSTASYTDACLKSGWNRNLTSTTIPQEIKGKKREIVEICIDVYIACKDKEPTSVQVPGQTSGSTTVTNSSCRALDTQTVVSLYQQMLTADRQTGSQPTPMNMDAGAICNAGDNSSNRFAKAISTIGQSTRDIISGTQVSPK